MSEVLLIVFWTLVIYSAISTLIFVLSRDNETVIEVFGLGIVGLVACFVVKILRSMANKFKYHIGKRSIFEDEETGARYICKVSDSEDIPWLKKYKRVKRYAKKSEWAGIPNFPEDVLAKAKINCDRCVHDKECECDYPYSNIKCEHDEYGVITNFNKFEKR